MRPPPSILAALRGARQQNSLPTDIADRQGLKFS